MKKHIFVSTIAIVLFCLLPAKAADIEIKFKSPEGLSFLKLLKQSPDLKGLKFKKCFQPENNKRHLHRNSKNRKTFQKKFQELGLDRLYRLKCDKNCDEEYLFQRLELSDHIEYMEENQLVKYELHSDPLLNSNGSLWSNSYSETWGLDRVKARTAWNTTEGAGSVVAVLDTGITFVGNYAFTDRDIVDNIWVDSDFVADANSDSIRDISDLDADASGHVDFNEIFTAEAAQGDVIGKDIYRDSFNVSGELDSLYQFDFIGHGTFIAGIIAAKKDNNIGLAGIAPRSKVMPIKVIGLDEDAFSLFRMADAIRYAVDNGADVLNISLAWNLDSFTIRSAFDYAIANNVIPVTSAGNNDEIVATAQLRYPAVYDNVISVASINQANAISDFSSYGSDVDIIAPGEEIVSAGHELSLIAFQNTKIDDGTSLPIAEDKSFFYYSSNGTSYAAPHVAGTIALLKSLKKDLSYSQVKRILEETADSNFTSGSKTFAAKAGVLDTSRAVQEYQNFLQGQFVGSLVLESSFNIPENFSISTWTAGFVGVEDGAFSSSQYSYSIVGEFNGLFTIGSVGNIEVTQPLDFETKSSYDVTVRVTDPEGNFLDQVLTFLVEDREFGDPNHPTDEEINGSQVTISNSEVQENTTGAIGRLRVSQSFRDYDFSIVSGNEDGNFAITNSFTNFEVVKALDFETKNQYTLTIRASDQDSDLVIENTITINVTNENTSFNQGNFLEATLPRRINSSSLVLNGLIAEISPRFEIDNSINYEVLGNKRARRFFSVNSNGQLIVSNTIPANALRKLKRLKFRVRATASDGSSTIRRFSTRVRR